MKLVHEYRARRSVVRYVIRYVHRPVALAPKIRSQDSTVLYSTVQYSAVQYSTVQYSTPQSSPVQYSTVQYSTTHNESTGRVLIHKQHFFPLNFIFKVVAFFTRCELKRRVGWGADIGAWPVPS